MHNVTASVNEDGNLCVDMIVTLYPSPRINCTWELTKKDGQPFSPEEVALIFADVDEVIRELNGDRSGTSPQQP